MTAAARVQRYRDRIRDGRIVVSVEIDVVDVVEMLVDAGVLAAWTDDREEIGRAVERQLQTLIELHRMTC
jgi:hypothetical protein